MALSPTPVFDQEHIPAQHDCYPMKWIAMPRHSLAGSKTQTTHHGVPVLKEDFVNHS
jgi:hypothetical protein